MGLLEFGRVDLFPEDAFWGVAQVKGGGEVTVWVGSPGARTAFGEEQVEGAVVAVEDAEDGDGARPVYEFGGTDAEVGVVIDGPAGGFFGGFWFAGMMGGDEDDFGFSEDGVELFV